jgi:transcriptional regulator with XRE-family HTH domain
MSNAAFAAAMPARAAPAAFPKKRLSPVDAHIGARVCMRRMMLGMSQEKLGDALNLTFQQVQKYEKGTNGIRGSRMQQISHVLQVPVAFFFEGLPPIAGRMLDNSAAPSATFVNAFLATQDGLSIARSFPQIEDAKLRRALVDVIELAAKKSKR